MRARRAWRSFLAASFSSYRNYRWGDSSIILVQTWLRSDLRVPNLKNFPGGARSQTPLTCLHRNGRTSLPGSWLWS